MMFDLLGYSTANLHTPHLTPCTSHPDPHTQISNLRSIAVVGAGGKTTLCWQLVQRALARGQRVIFTTTTKIWQPAPQAFDVMLLAPDLTQALLQLQARTDWRSACVVAGADPAAAEIGVLAETRFLERDSVNHMPVLPHKMLGYAPDAICTALAYSPSHCQWVIEADGARGALLKAPDAHEPMIPACVDGVVVVANRDVIGQPLARPRVHRPEIVARLAGLALGEVMTPQAFMRVITHPKGGLKSLPPNAVRGLLLTGSPCDVPMVAGVFDWVMTVDD